MRWIGYFDYEKMTNKVIEIDQSWSDIQLYIDDQNVLPGSYTFTEGRHKIECRFTNNWHTDNFMVSFNDPETILSKEEAMVILKEITSESAHVVYVGIYESYNIDHDSTVILSDQNEDVILFLSSYHAVNWKIKNPYGVNIKAIVYNSLKLGTNVTYPDSEETYIFRYDDLIQTSSIYPSYRKEGYSYIVDNDEFLKLNKQVESLTGHRIDGFTGEYEGDFFVVPSVILDESEYDEINNAYETLDEVLNRAPQRPDNLFGEASLNKPWSQFFSCESSMMPNAFTAYYFDTNNLEKIVAVEEMDEPYLNTGIDRPYGIEIEDLGTCYIGEFNFAKDTKQVLNIQNGTAFLRLIVDGQILYNSWETHEKQIEYTFTKGKHVIECEFINDWHTADLSLSFSEKLK